MRLHPKDTDALQTKLFLLLQTEQYKAALELMGETDAYVFEKAYALYRLQQEVEASQKVDEIKTQHGADRGIVHLEAQMVNDRFCFLSLRN